MGIPFGIPLPTTELLALEFGEWLDEQYNDAKTHGRGHLDRYREEPPCLLDIIADWVSHEILRLPDYGTFMGGVIHIIDSWVRGDRRTIEGFAIWPHPETREAQIVESLFPWELADDGERLVPDTPLGGVSHRLLNPGAYEATRRRSENSHVRHVEYLLEQLTARQHN